MSGDILTYPTATIWQVQIWTCKTTFAHFFGGQKKRQKREKPVEIIFTSPIEKATTLLQQLESKELWQKGEIKSYYSELTDIARNYIEEEIKIPAMESTTSELIVSLRKVASQKKLKQPRSSLSIRGVSFCGVFATGKRALCPKLEFGMQSIPNKSNGVKRRLEGLGWLIDLLDWSLKIACMNWFLR